tara:strand:- start:2437 stop:5253 length:2817 start_codon:yes stop_codon:yes gene_type:complete
MNKFFLLLSFLLSGGLIYCQVENPSYKQMMEDLQYNFYEVVEAAESYFATHEKGKGSGWTPYQRWKAENEPKYFPSGDRSGIDPLFAEKAYLNFLKNNSSAENKAQAAGIWKDLGPYDANRITSHYSPGIGRVESFWVNPNNSSHIFLGSRSGGFWKTINEGQSWKNTTDHLIASGVNTIAVSPFNPDSVLINVRNGGNNTSHGIYRSTDAGETWFPSNFTPDSLGWGGLGSSDQIYKIAYHPRIPNLVYVGTNNGFYKSIDNLQTWTKPLSSGRITDIEFHPSNDSIIYLVDVNNSNGNAVSISDDFGDSFVSGPNFSSNGSAQLFIAVSPACDDCLYAASANGLWKSFNRGQNFKNMGNPNQSCRGFAVSDLDSSKMLYGYVDLLASTDGGTSFNQVSWWANSTPDPTYVHADLRTAESVNGVYYVGTDGYLAKSLDNGITWIRLNDGTGIREFYAVGLSQSQASTQMAGSQDNGTSILDETGWFEWNGGDGMEAIIQPLNDNWMIGSWQYGSRNRTTDAGQSRNGLSGTGNAAWQAPLLLNPNEQMTVYHFDSQIHISSEFGDFFQPYGNPLIGDILVAAIAENNSNLIIASRNSAIKLSDDGGLTWENIRSNLPNQSISDIAFDPQRDSTIIVSYRRYQNDGKKVFISHDLGNSWANITHNLNDMPIRSVVIDHSDSSYIYLGAEIGVYYKSMQSDNWKLYGQNLPNATVRDLEIQYGSNTLRAATWGRGLWETSLVGRSNHPCIISTTINDLPDLDHPKENVPQKVSSVISYDGNLSEVKLQWSVSKPSLDQSIAMINISDSTWQSQTAIPNFPFDSIIFFKVVAKGANNYISETYKFMYRIRYNANASLVSSNFKSQISISPNPGKGYFEIDMGQYFDRFEVEIYDLKGSLILQKEIHHQRIFPFTIEEASGIYLVKIKSGENQAQYKIMKQ